MHTCSYSPERFLSDTGCPAENTVGCQVPSAGRADTSTLANVQFNRFPSFIHWSGEHVSQHRVAKAGRIHNHKRYKHYQSFVVEVQKSTSTVKAGRIQFMGYMTALTWFSIPVSSYALPGSKMEIDARSERKTYYRAPVIVREARYPSSSSLPAGGFRAVGAGSGAQLTTIELPSTLINFFKTSGARSCNNCECSIIHFMPAWLV